MTLLFLISSLTLGDHANLQPEERNIECDDDLHLSDQEVDDYQSENDSSLGNDVYQGPEAHRFVGYIRQPITDDE